MVPHNGTAVVYKQDRTVRFILNHGGEEVWGVAWRGGRIATVGSDGNLKIWDETLGTLLFTIPHPDAVYAVDAES